jgi:non-ribosomal peptide synthetase component F
MQEWELPGLTLHTLPVESGKGPFDLVLVLRETPEGLSGSLKYSTDLFDATTITGLLKHFQNLLESIVADPEQYLGNLSLLTDAETGGYTPFDFPDAELSQKDFENLLLEISKGIEME